MSFASQNRSLSGAPSSSIDDRRVTVVLGPTNTGKTHLALERMTGYGSGMIGFRCASWHARITTGLWQGWGHRRWG